MGSEWYRGNCFSGLWCTTHQGSSKPYCCQPFCILRMIAASLRAWSICSKIVILSFPGGWIVAISFKPQATASGPSTECVLYNCLHLLSHSDCGIWGRRRRMSAIHFLCLPASFDKQTSCIDRHASCVFLSLFFDMKKTFGTHFIFMALFIFSCSCRAKENLSR